MGVLLQQAVLEIADEVFVGEDGQPTESVPGVELRVKCRSCPQRRTFVAANERLLARQVASSGWNIEAGIAECPRCWLNYQGSIMRAAEGRN